MWPGSVASLAPRDHHPVPRGSSVPLSTADRPAKAARVRRRHRGARGARDPLGPAHPGLRAPPAGSVTPARRAARQWALRGHFAGNAAAGQHAQPRAARAAPQLSGGGEMDARHACEMSCYTGPRYKTGEVK